MSSGPPLPPFPPLPGFHPDAFGVTRARSGIIGLPVGSVTAFAGSLDAADADATDLQFFNWRNCDGGALPKLEFEHLYKVIKGTYGEAEETFNLPNYAGFFFRARATNAEEDPDIDGRVPPPGGGAKDAVGSTQDCALQDHIHSDGVMLDPTTTAQPPGKPVLKKTDTGTAKPAPGASPLYLSDKETRPRNIYVNWIIKVAYTPAELAALTGEKPVRRVAGFPLLP